MNYQRLKEINLSTDMMDASQVSSYVKDETDVLSANIQQIKFSQDNEFDVQQVSVCTESDEGFYSICDAGNNLIIGGKRSGIYVYHKDTNSMERTYFSTVKNYKLKQLVKGKKIDDSTYEYVTIAGEPTKVDSKNRVLAYYSRDNGMSWTEKYLDTDTELKSEISYLNTIHFINDTYYMMCGRQVIYSQDINSTWTTVECPSTTALFGERNDFKAGNAAYANGKLYILSMSHSLYVATFDISSKTFDGIKYIGKKPKLANTENVTDTAMYADNGNVYAMIRDAGNKLLYSIFTFDGFQTYGCKDFEYKVNLYPRCITKCGSKYYIGFYDGTLVQTANFFSMKNIDSKLAAGFAIEGIASDKKTVYYATAKDGGTNYLMKVDLGYSADFINGTESLDAVKIVDSLLGNIMK